MGLLERFGGRVRKARKALNVSQEELASMSSLDRFHMGEIKRGQTSPTLITINRIAKALNCSIAGFVNMMMNNFFSLSFILCSFHLSAATLDVEIQGVTDGGVLHLAIYSSKEVFESDRGDKPGAQPGIEAGVVEKIGKGTYKGSFEIPPGTYAIGVYIDENENEKLDTNFFGIPKEQYGFSNNAKAFGIPKFEAASFVIDTYKKVQIGL